MIRHTLAAAALSLVAASAAQAQTTTSPMAASPMAATPSTMFMTVPSTAMLSYNLIGLTVTDPANDTVGEIKDLVLDQGKLAGFIVSVGGFLGIGEHYVVVAPSAVNVSYDATNTKWKAVMSTTKDQLKAAPEFKYEGKFKH